MKKNIHPKWNPAAKVTCACGSTFETGSVVSEIKVDTCSACHPFFTGALHKFVDTAGRVDKFNQRVAAAERKRAEAEERRLQREAAAASS